MATSSGSGMSSGTLASFRAAARKVASAARQMKGPLGAMLRQAGEEIMTDVKASSPGRGVPRDKGALASSGRVTGPTGTEKAPRVTLSFGDSSAPYALIQHENLSFNHRLGEARYLVRGIERWKPGGSAAMEGLAAAARAALKE